MTSRDNTIDVLRTIGLLSIILAHVSPPLFINSLRTFDVPLMVIVSAFAYSGSRANSLPYSDYLKKRINRLIVPVWIFLILYFIFFYMVDLLTGNHTVTLLKILCSFLLLNNDSIGYVWIIRIFIIVATLSPLLKIIARKVETNAFYLLIVLAVMSGYSFVVSIPANSLFDTHSRLVFTVFYEYLLYSIPYSLIFLIGLIIKQKTSFELFFTSILLLCGFLITIYFLNISFNEINSFKNPPQHIWLVYGVAGSILLYSIVSKISLNKNVNKLIVFISSSSMWIYLWHIFILNMWGYGISYVPIMCKYYIIKFMIIVLLSSGIVFTQKRIISCYLRNTNLSKQVKSFFNIAFM